ncbi:unnamed protein product [Anisakis simplex]|uniref:Pepsin inhibitor-3-like repeated domain-containing protein n=1 Tax=Anisakis simplex TaxID=6269 RepID=A0A3P6S1I6_ANISI|nr:unnamed protein product [Anisakis simplex]
MQCTVKGNEVYLAGLPWVLLSDDQLQEASEYQKRYERCAQKTPFPPASCTKPPAFCAHNATTLYNFAGCDVLGDNVYWGGHFVRHMTHEDQLKLANFIAAWAKYQIAEQKFQIKHAHDPYYLRALSMGMYYFPGAPVQPTTPDFCGTAATV